MGRKKRSGEIHLLSHISVIRDGMWTHSAGCSKMVVFVFIHNDKKCWQNAEMSESETSGTGALVDLKEL